MSMQDKIVKGFCKQCGANFDYPGDFCKCPDPVPEGSTEIEKLQHRIKQLEKRLEQEKVARQLETGHLKDQVIFWRKLARNVNVTASTLL